MGIYERLGLQPIINATGSVTRLGGAPMPPDVLQAFCEAAGEWVPLEQLQAAASRVIARLTGAEAGIVTSGAAAALTLGAAAIITRDDLSRIEALPHCAEFPHEFVVAREQRSGYDHAVRAAGARLVEVGCNEIVSGAGVRRTEAWEYEAAFGPRTAGVLYVYTPTSQPALREVVQVATRHNLPVLVDAAGQLPPRGNLALNQTTGADLVAFSGGKAIRGPQATGILCGRRDLVGAAVLQMLDMDEHATLWDPPVELFDRDRLPGLPRHGIGRSLKVSKEQIAALLTALELFSSGAYDAERQQQRERLELIVGSLRGLPVRCVIHESPAGKGAERLELQLDEAAIGKTAWDVCRELRGGSPPIFVGHGSLAAGRLVVDPLCLNHQTAAIVGQRLADLLRKEQ